LEDCTQGFDAQQVKTSLDIVAGQDGLFGYISNSNEVIKATEATLASLTNQQPPSPVPCPNSRLPSMAQLRRLYRSGATTPDQVVNMAFDLIDSHKKAHPGVWISLESRENCVKSARQLADKYAGRPLPPLYGLPFSVKDIIDVAGVETTAACLAYAYIPTSHAKAVQLVLDAGGIYVGKTNLDQLATGLSGCRSPYGVPHSTFSGCHISGGSSSGGAVSVGAGLVYFALATDTAGSGGIPAAFNGVVGFKPTKGTVSAKGLVPACKTLDGITVMAHTVPEARTVWQVIAQHDRDDPYSKPPHTLPTWAIDFRGVQRGGFTFGIPPAICLEVCTPAYRALFSEAVGMLEKCGGALRKIDYTVFERAGKLLYNGALLHERITCIGQEFLKSNTDKLHPVTKQLYSLAFATAPSAYDVFRDQAFQVELTRRAQQSLDTLNGGVDVIVVPTTVCHPTIEDMNADPIALNSRLGIFTQFANVVDLCGVNVPAGTYAGEHGTVLPFGITILGGSGFDAKILDVAAVFQASTEAQASLV
jgi:allophanate hydrolase